MLRRRLAVSRSAAAVIEAGRRIEWAAMPAVARVAILAEAAGALAALARHHARLSHIDSQLIADLVTDPADAFAVLGRGRWLPTMHRPVLAVATGQKSRRGNSSRRSALRAAQPTLFDDDKPRGGEL